jgi:hypothetical protein
MTKSIHVRAYDTPHRPCSPRCGRTTLIWDFARKARWPVGETATASEGPTTRQRIRARAASALTLIDIVGATRKPRRG